MFDLQTLAQNLIVSTVPPMGMDNDEFYDFSTRRSMAAQNFAIALGIDRYSYEELLNKAYSLVG